MPVELHHQHHRNRRSFYQLILPAESMLNRGNDNNNGNNGDTQSRRSINKANTEDYEGTLTSTSSIDLQKELRQYQEEQSRTGATTGALHTLIPPATLISDTESNSSCDGEEEEEEQRDVCSGYAVVNTTPSLSRLSILSGEFFRPLTLEITAKYAPTVNVKQYGENKSEPKQFNGKRKATFHLLPINGTRERLLKGKDYCLNKVITTGAGNPPDITLRGVSRGNYSQLHSKAWLEVTDKHHRYGKNLRVYYRYWETLSSTTDSFFDWLDGTSSGTLKLQVLPDLEECPRSILDTDTVLYIDDFEVTKQYAVSFQCDLADGSGRAKVCDVNNEPISTGEDGWIFVLRDGVVYASRKVAKSSNAICLDTNVNCSTCKKSQVVGQRFHHSSFFGGKAVAAAGIFITDEDGYLTRLYPHSGHYRPGEADLQRMLMYLRNTCDVDLTSFDVDIQQFVYINRKENTPQQQQQQDCCAIDEKCKKTDSLYLQSAMTVAHYFSHKAYCSASNSIFDSIVNLNKQR